MEKETGKGIFCISLDFELFWGMHDVVDSKQFQPIVETTTKEAIPGILKLFHQYDIHATWATVGGILAENCTDFINHAPEDSHKPSYQIEERSSYRLFEGSEDRDSLLFYPHLVDQIRNIPNQEIGTHTYSHYYCDEEGQTTEQFLYDLESAKAISQSKGIILHSIVFPRNQIKPEYLKICKKEGIVAYRGLESNWIYNRIKFTPVLRALRLLDAYIPLSGANVHEPCVTGGMVNITGSRLLRPYTERLAAFEQLKVRRIKKQMLKAAKTGKIFHLWWHPHNFGTNTEQNLKNLEEILSYYQELNRKYGYTSLNMGEIADRLHLTTPKRYGPVVESRCGEAAEIYNKVFDGEATYESLHRKHFENPVAHKPQLFGAYDGDKLIGINGFLDMEYEYNGVKLKSIQSCDTAVDPDYRNQGIFTGIIRAKEQQLIEEGYDLLVGFPNFNSYPGFIKMGWTEITRTSKLFLPVNAQKVIRHMTGLNLTRVANLFSWYLWKKIKKYANNDDITIEKKNEVNVEEFQECVESSKVHFVINKQILDWKLHDLSGHFIIYDKGKIIGRIITARTDYKDRMRRTNLVAFSFSVDDQRLIKIALAKILCELKEDFDLICVWDTTNRFISAALHELGFLNNIATKEGSPFIVKTLTQDSEKKKIIDNKEFWSPSQIETDTMVNM